MKTVKAWVITNPSGDLIEGIYYDKRYPTMMAKKFSRSCLTGRKYKVVPVEIREIKDEQES